jgi:hypothetical protein
MWEIMRDEQGYYFAVIDGVTVIRLDANTYTDAICEADQRCGVNAMTDQYLQVEDDVVYMPQVDS